MIETCSWSHFEAIEETFFFPIQPFVFVVLGNYENFGMTKKRYINDVRCEFLIAKTKICIRK